MILRVLAAALFMCGIILIAGVRGNKSAPVDARASLPPSPDKSEMTGEMADDSPRRSEPAEGPEADDGAASTLAAVEHFTRNRSFEALERMFDDPGLPAATKAALIGAALDLDQPQLITRAETLALNMIGQGGAAEVLAVLPKVSQFPENSRVREVRQESLCRFHGFGFEIVKLKYDRTFPNGRPWEAVCKTS